MSSDGVRKRRLLAVLANPPLTTSGLRTVSRVELAAGVIECEEVVIGNLFVIPSKDVTELGVLGLHPDGWMDARADLLEKLPGVDDVILGWGCSEPSGAARLHHRAQVEWLREMLVGHPAQVWTVGGVPRHPSRWQRYTYRAHPELPFVDALRRSLHVGIPAR